MTEITRVPLRPIAKGSLTKLWIGVIVAIGLAVLLAWALAPQGYGLTVLEEGDGASPSADDVAFMNYVGKLDDGTVFDQSQPLPLPPEAQGMFPQGNPMPLSNMMPSFTEGVTKMKPGGTYELRIPADQAYGAEAQTNPQTGEVIIPANSDLTFEIELIDFMSQAEFQRRVQMITQLMQQNGTLAPPQGEAPMPPPQ
ncbi:MAG: peptidylprolyl isomerase [Erythrobacter sp.]|nr:peptidylprolyl isomerase [Erythrobacter sp.]NCQ63662.1 peptidylprolyl isomerase [Alphaproteobacteria bacterium]